MGHSGGIIKISLHPDSFQSLMTIDVPNPREKRGLRLFSFPGSYNFTDCPLPFAKGIEGKRYQLIGFYTQTEEREACVRFAAYDQDQLDMAPTTQPVPVHTSIDIPILPRFAGGIHQEQSGHRAFSIAANGTKKLATPQAVSALQYHLFVNDMRRLITHGSPHEDLLFTNIFDIICQDARITFAQIPAAAVKRALIQSIEENRQHIRLEPMRH